MKHYAMRFVLLVALAAAGCVGTAGTPVDPSTPSTPTAPVTPASTPIWSVGFVPWPGLNVHACWPPTRTDVGIICAEVLHPNADGSLHEVWEPPTPNTVQVDGTLTATAVSASLRCASTGTGSGTLSAVWTGSQYDGTATFNGQSVTIWVRKGNDTSACIH
jgi:hypothetical protein